MNECTTAVEAPAHELTAGLLGLEQARWDELAAHLPLDLAASAKASGAWVRRRGIQRAVDLLRLVFAYAVCDWSLRLVGAWLVTLGLADLSDVAIFKRLQHCQRWLGELVTAVLAQRQVWLAPRPGVRLRLVDASQVTDRRHAKWYVHACFDLGSACLAGVAVTDHHSGESLARFPGQAGEIVLADRGYAQPKGLGASLAQQAQLVVRCHWQNLTLEDAAGQRLDGLAWLKTCADTTFRQPAERAVWLTTPQGRFALRLVVAALPPAAAERARRRVREAAWKKGRTPSQDNLFAAGFILVLTNLPVAAWSAAQVLDLYRFRWQVELLFKRYKSIVQLDHLRAHDPALVQTYLLAKLLAALLLDTLLPGNAALLAEWGSACERPLSLWRLAQWGWAQLLRCVQGTITWAQLLAALPHLQRFLCDSPRRRPQQLATARAWLARLSAC
jgi:hypothetical protein